MVRLNYRILEVFFSGNFPHFLTNLGKFKLFSITISYILCTLVW